MTQTLAQRRAFFALERVAKHKSDGKYGRYLSYVEALPAAIRANGLGQAIALELSRAASDPGHRALSEDVRDWLCGPDEIAPYRDHPEAHDASGLLTAITKNDQRRYLRAQAEALALLVWIKKFARAMLDRGDGRP